MLWTLLQTHHVIPAYPNVCLLKETPVSFFILHRCSAEKAVIGSIKLQAPSVFLLFIFFLDPSMLLWW